MHVLKLASMSLLKKVKERKKGRREERTKERKKGREEERKKEGKRKKERKEEKKIAVFVLTSKTMLEYFPKT